MLLSEDVVFSPMEEEVLVFGKVADVGRKDGACASWSWLRCFTNSCGYEPRMVYCVFGWVGGNVCVCCVMCLQCCSGLAVGTLSVERPR